METILQDLRYGLRILIKYPIVTAAAVIALALGIGANTLIFSAVNSILLRPLPYKDPQRLVMLWNTILQEGNEIYSVAPADFEAFKDQSNVFEQMAAFQYEGFNLAGAGDPERLQGATVSANLFSLLGVAPSLGRAFSAEEDQPGRNQVVILSDNLWRSRFSADPNIIGKPLTLNNQSYTIVGVMPPGFDIARGGGMPAGLAFSPNTDLWLPLGLKPGDPTQYRHYLHVVARLKPGITISQAQANLSAIAARLEQENPDAHEGLGATVVDMREQVLGNVRPALLLLLGSVVFVLLIACSNVANLLLARAKVREREISLRTALGAGRLRLIRQLLTESLQIALIGGALGLLLAFLGLKLFVGVGTSKIPRLQEVSLDWRILVFTLLITVLTGVIFGLVPALQASRPNLNDALKEGGVRTAGTSSGRRIQSILVVSEVALSLVLLIGAGLVIRSFIRLQNVDPGIRAENVLTMQVALPEPKYEAGEKMIAFYKQALDNIKNLRGVESVSLVTALPLSGLDRDLPFSIEGRPLAKPGDFLTVSYRFIGPDYFKTMGIPLLRGRYFTEGDQAQTPGVLIIDENMARRFWPNEDPLGQRISIPNGPTLTVAGIVGGIKHQGLDAKPLPIAYLSYLQVPPPMMGVLGRPVTFVVRTTADPRSRVADVRNAIQMVDKDQPVSLVRTMEQVVSDSLSERRFNMVLLGIFAVVALVLTGVGIYSVISYSVTQRTHEIGVRMALGANRSDIVKLVVKQAATVSLAGILIGLVAAFVLAHLMASLLFEVSITDPIVFFAASAFLGTVALAACYIPARRAAKVDPIIALRYE